MFIVLFSLSINSSANATPEFEGRGGEELGMELSNTLYKVFNNKHSVDLKSLCISPGEHCWVLYVDVLVSGCTQQHLSLSEQPQQFSSFLSFLIAAYLSLLPSEVFRWDRLSTSICTSSSRFLLRLIKANIYIFVCG